MNFSLTILISCPRFIMAKQRNRGSNTVSSNSDLSLLLANGPPKQRCIHRVEAELEQILAARAQRLTWDAIAEALGMKRCTLINAVKRLQQSTAVPQMTPPRMIQAQPVIVKPIAQTVQPTPTPTPTPIPIPQPLPPSSTEPMVIAVGRAQVEDYQL